jgi:8-oxo-dGTP diphosphatase
MQIDRFHLIAAVFILLAKDDKVFLIKRANTGWEDGKWSIMGGHLDGNETAVHAAIREANEEAGVVIKPEELQFFNVAHIITNSERIHLSFVSYKWDGEPKNNEPDKASEVGWFSMDNLPDRLTDISRETLDWFKNKTVYAESGWERQS